MEPHLFFDLRQRYNNTSSNYEKIPYSQQKQPITKIPVDEIEYERPYWVAPDLSGEHGNHFVLISLVSEHLESLGFKHESNEFKNIVFGTMKKNDTNIYQVINKFLNYFDSISSKVIEDEEYIKITKQPLEFLQPKEFNNVDLKSVQQLNKEGFDFNKKNIYGRSILFYTKDKQTMEWIFDNIYNKEGDYFKLFELDVFNTSLLIKHGNPEIMDFILERMLSKENENLELIRKWCIGVDVFSRCLEDSIVKNLNSIFTKDSDFSSYSNHVKETAKLFSKLNKVYPEFTNSIINVGSNAFKEDKAKHNFWKEHMEKEYLDQSLQLRKPNDSLPKVKKAKI